MDDIEDVASKKTSCLIIKKIYTNQQILTCSPNLFSIRATKHKIGQSSSKSQEKNIPLGNRLTKKAVVLESFMLAVRKNSFQSSLSGQFCQKNFRFKMGIERVIIGRHLTDRKPSIDTLTKKLLLVVPMKTLFFFFKDQGWWGVKGLLFIFF